MAHSSQHFHDDKEKKLKETVYFCEATGYEQLSIWREEHERHDWVQDMSGFSQVIGYIDKKRKKPVNVSFSFAVVDGQRICFYEAISRYVDHKMVEEFIVKNYPVKYDQGQRRAMDDAMNFRLDAVKEANEKIQYVRLKNLLEDIGVVFDKDNNIIDGHQTAKMFLSKSTGEGTLGKI